MSAIPTYGGCCRNDEWRGRPCPYHEGYEDGLDEDAYHEGYKDGRETLDDYRSVVRRLLDGWRLSPNRFDPTKWHKYGGFSAWIEEPISDAERAVINEVTP